MVSERTTNSMHACSRACMHACRHKLGLQAGREALASSAWSEDDPNSRGGYKMSEPATFADVLVDANESKTGCDLDPLWVLPHFAWKP